MQVVWSVDGGASVSIFVSSRAAEDGRVEAVCRIWCVVMKSSRQGVPLAVLNRKPRLDLWRAGGVVFGAVTKCSQVLPNT